jgi:serine/threonine protein phosphatase PrpC
VTVATLKECFGEMTLPVFDPQGFLTLSLARAHDRVVKLGDGVALDHKPRATCAVCLVQDGGAYWAHVGDSRIYHLRRGGIHARTRDHSHVELLLREGLITAEQVNTHPMRNFVECCIGGDIVVPDMSLSARKPLQPNDMILACTDGLWSGVRDADLAAHMSAQGTPLRDLLASAGERAIAANGTASDNTSAVVLRWMGP